MRKGEKIMVERLDVGLYRITLPNGVMMIGAAPSTAIALTNAVFRTEAQEVPGQELFDHGKQSR